MDKELRKQILQSSFDAGACHIGSALSCVEVLLAIDGARKETDIFLFSKASGVAAYYVLLAERGYFSREKIVHYLKNYPLASKEVPGIIHSVGSLGHGLSVACGLALGDRMRNVYCLVSDGELNEGSSWEAILFAAHHKLKNLIVVVDYNKIQACGRTEDILGLEKLSDKFSSFGWWALNVDGHDKKTLEYVLGLDTIKPKAIIAHTTKGKGIDFLEDKVEWHYLNLSEELLNKALSQL